MEVINLFLLLGGYYIFYNLWFYQKVLLLFCSSLFTSLIINHKYIEEKSNDPDGKKFVYFVLATIINITFFMHNFILELSNKSLNVPLINHGYEMLKQVNQLYLVGRNQIVTRLGNMVFKTMMPSNPKPIINKEKPKNVFKSDGDMNNFLDSLIDKKTN
tara:strand:+ start:16 stop:492 length:477 start_codon:yes stop_codon:yes gene_type:complete